MKTKFKRIYFDYAATTPLDPLVEEALSPYFQKYFGNAGSLHLFGQEALSGLDKAREKIAEELGVNFRNIIFTGSATEASNLCLRGVVKSFRNRHPAVRMANGGEPNVIISSVEHSSVFETAHDLERDGVEVKEISVDKEGVVNLGELKEKLDENTILVSVMYVNNEVGTIQPITEIANIIRDFRNSKTQEQKASGQSPDVAASYPLFHTDAVQAFQYFPCRPDDLGIDFLTISAHKIYGPKGIGLLYFRSPEYLSPLITGGGQEFGLRSGTENVAFAVGFAKAVELISEGREKEYERIKSLSSYFIEELGKTSVDFELNGPKKEKRCPHIVNLYFPHLKAGEILVKLDAAGIAVSPGSACSARSLRGSRVIRNIYSEERAESSIRLSFGKHTTKEEIERALPIIAKSVIF